MDKETGLPKILIVYYSKTGNTRMMADAIAEGAKEYGEVEVTVKAAEKTTNQDLLEADCIVLGSPTYFRLPAWQIKRLIDESIDVYEKLNGKKGGVFSSAGDSNSGKYCIEALKGILTEHGIRVIGKGILIKEKPESKGLKACRDYGTKIAGQL